MSEVNNNVLSAFLVTREAFPHMAKTGGGSVINFARAGNAQANMLPYNVAKAGVTALTRTFALEGKEAKIRVNAVAPGLVDTASNVNMMKPKDTSKWAKRDEIADVVVFLASPSVARRDGSGASTSPAGGSRSPEPISRGSSAAGRERLPRPRRSTRHTQEVPMGEGKIDHEHEVGGFNPERRNEKPKRHVGPAPTDDPRGKATPDLKNKIDRKCTQRGGASWQRGRHPARHLRTSNAR